MSDKGSPEDSFETFGEEDPESPVAEPLLPGSVEEGSKCCKVALFEGLLEGCEDLLEGELVEEEG